MKLTKQNASAYLSQLIGLLGLLALNFLLPVIVGVNDYGVLAFSLAVTYTSVTIIDEGANLLIARRGIKKSILLIKVLFSSLLCTTMIILSEVTFEKGIIYLLQTISYVVYTALIANLTYNLKNEYLPVCGLVFSALLFCLPLLFLFFSIEIQYAVAGAFLCSAGFAFWITRLVASAYDPQANNKAISQTSAHTHRDILASAIYLSIPVGVYGFVMWFGVFLLGSDEDFEGASILRIALSGVGLLSFLVPIHRNTLAREFDNAGFQTLKTPVLYGTLIILAFTAFAWQFGPDVLSYLYGQQGVAISINMISLVPLFLLKILIDILLIASKPDFRAPAISAQIVFGILVASLALYLNIITYILFSYILLLWASACLAFPIYRESVKKNAS